MNRALLITLLTLMTFSCCPYHLMPKFEAKIKGLQSENDSLKTIIMEFNKKYPSDSISNHNFPSYNDR